MWDYLPEADRSRADCRAAAGTDFHRRFDLESAGVKPDCERLYHPVYGNAAAGPDLPDLLRPRPVPVDSRDPVVMGSAVAALAMRHVCAGIKQRGLYHATV